MASKQILRLGTRASALARWQAEWVAGQLAERGVETELILISTQGDQKPGPIGSLGGQGVFTKEIQRALLDEQIDSAVHSLKDLPTDVVEGLCLAAVPVREVNGDVLISRDSQAWSLLPPAARIGTGSLRRQAQLLHARRDIEVSDIRGNVETRLRKLADGQYDAIVLAEAGLRRLGLQDHITQLLPFSLMLPAVGQGALGIETRQDDAATRQALEPLDDPATRAAVVAERAMLAALRGGCLAPVGAWARSERGRLRLDAVVLSRDGRLRIDASETAVDEVPEALGRRVAEQLLGDGAADLIHQSRTS